MEQRTNNEIKLNRPGCDAFFRKIAEEIGRESKMNTNESMAFIRAQHNARPGVRALLLRADECLSGSRLYGNTIRPKVKKIFSPRKKPAPPAGKCGGVSPSGFERAPYQIIIMSFSISEHDAIGNDVEAMYDILSQKYRCGVFAETQTNERLNSVTTRELKKCLQDERCIVIYHHGFYWGLGEALLKNCRCRLVFKYHNITPAEFFEPYSSYMAKYSRLGRSQTERFISEYPAAAWLADSNYNAADLPGSDKVGVCPPFNKIEDMSSSKPDEPMLASLKHDPRIKLLFVGRVAPNKGHLFLLRVVKNYIVNYDSNIVLTFAGKFDDRFRAYTEELQAAAEAWGLSGNIRFSGELSDGALLACYGGSDFFVCASEHEGFCVPLLEAQRFGLLIIARDTSAVRETAGANQLILGEDPSEYAAAIHILYHHKEYADYLKKQGYKNYETRFSYRNIAECFGGLIDFR